MESSSVEIKPHVAKVFTSRIAAMKKQVMNQRKELYPELSKIMISVLYSALRAGYTSDDDLQTYVYEILGDLCQSAYERKTNGKDMCALQDDAFDVLLDKQIVFARMHYDEKAFSKIQALRAASKRKFEVKDLLKVANLSIKESARVLKCSTATVSRLRRMAKILPISYFLDALKNKAHLFAVRVGRKIDLLETLRNLRLFAQMFRSDFTPIDAGPSLQREFRIVSS